MKKDFRPQININYSYKLYYISARNQVCRPHFHPWTSPADAKPSMMPHSMHHAGATWCTPFPSKPSSHHTSPPSMGVHHGPSASSHSSPHIFSFPPTPPKDSTPDNVSGGSGHSSSVSTSGGNSGPSLNSNSLSTGPNSGEFNLITSLGSALSNCSSSKPREGTPHYHSPMNPYYPGHYPVPASSGPPTSCGDASYGFPHHHTSLLSAKSDSLQSNSNSANKQRTKGRSSAGKRNIG